MANPFKDYRWHSVEKPGRENFASRKVKALPVTARVMNAFSPIGCNSGFLVNKSSKALWTFTEDGKAIVPVFDEDEIREDEI